jgi:hypothetical protein
MVVPELKVLYCPIAKNACTSLKRTMVRISDIPMKEEILSGGVHVMTDQNNTGIQLCEFHVEKVNEILADTAYFTFVVIREPFERMLSAYIEKFVMNRKDKAQWRHTGAVVAAVQGCGVDDVDYDRGITFRAFVEHVVSQPPKKLDTHWRPQFLYLEGVPYAHVYTVRDIARLTEDLSRHTGIDIEIERENVTSGKVEEVDVEGATDMDAAQLSRFGQVSTKS